MATKPFAAATRFSICEHVLRLGDLALDVAAAVEAGANGFSLNAADFGGVSVAEAGRIIEASGLTITSYIDPAVMRLGPGEPDRDMVARAADDAAALGSPALLFIAGEIGDRESSAADQHLVDVLGSLAARLAEAGVRPMLEPLHPIARDLSYVHTLRHALEIVAHVEGAGIVVDTGASWWERDLVTEVAANLDRIEAIQITNVRGDEMTRRVYVREQCGVPGAVPVGELVRAFAAAGYVGWFEHEVLAPLPAERRRAMVREDREWFESLWADDSAAHHGEPH